LPVECSDIDQLNNIVELTADFVDTEHTVLRVENKTAPIGFQHCFHPHSHDTAEQNH
jgi:hypothetical protein